MNKLKYQLTEDEFLEWKKKRKSTMVVFVITLFFVGIEHSMVFFTLWIYLKEMVHTEHPKLFYSIIAGAYLLSTILTSNIIARYVDIHRNVKSMSLVICVLAIIGNLMYSCYYSPWFLFFGRVIAGLVGSLKPIYFGELARCYEDLSMRVAVMTGFWELGVVIGPLVTFIFKDNDVSVGGFQIRLYNAGGIYMALFFAFLFVIILIFVHDISAEYDIKLQREKEDEQRNASCLDSDLECSMTEHDSFLIPDNKDHATISSSVGFSKVFIKMFSSSNILVILASSFLVFFNTKAWDLWFPLLVTESLKWSINDMFWIATLPAIVSLILLVIIVFYTLSNKELYWLGVLSVVSILAMQFVHLALKYLYFQNDVQAIIIWCIYAILFGIVTMLENVFLSVVLANMTSSRVQSFVESIRSSCSRLGGLIALFSAPYLFDYLNYVLTIIASFTMFILVMVLIKRKLYSNPKIIIK